MSSRKCPHENAIEVCMFVCEDIFAYKSSFEIYFRIKDTRTYIRRPTTLYIVKSLHHGPYVSFKSCLLLAYFTIWHMAWKTKCVQTLFTLEDDRLPKNPWIHLILNWKKSKLQLPAKKTKVERRKKRSSKKKRDPFSFNLKKKRKPILNEDELCQSYFFVDVTHHHAPQPPHTVQFDKKIPLTS